MPINMTASVATRFAKAIRDEKDYKLNVSDSSMFHAVNNPRHLDDFQTTVRKSNFGPDIMVVNVTQCPEGGDLTVLARKDVYDIVKESAQKLERELRTSIKVERIGFFESIAFS